MGDYSNISYSTNWYLVFKLNPGPTRSKISPIASVRHSYRRLRPTTSRDAEQPSRLSSRNTNNLITVNCSNYLNVHYQSLKLGVLNARSVRNDILNYICECKLDVVGITESWLSYDDAAVRTELCPDGYKFLNHPRDGLRGGGTGLIYRDLCAKKLDAGIKRSFEFSEWSVTTSSHKLRIVVLYRPPYSSEHNVPMRVFSNEFSNYLESLLLSKEPLLIFGDFNIHIDDAVDTDSFKYQDWLESVGLRQHVTQATHTHGHNLDLII
ncbi:Hypothetical predicted protein [Paramuricea clavata]|uniref:Endonuclease/exonuclease/phosphatase domain-containing protein n=1 Tax=Paramuricea clavata TaxID=317549 RepID=A0A6S7IJ10_PARCT|nr:Hypothetical predicted protein [Paramuricea clavata]